MTDSRSKNQCLECGAIVEGASYDHDPKCSEFPVTPGSPDWLAMRAGYPRDCQHPREDQCCLFSYTWPLCTGALLFANSERGKAALLKAVAPRKKGLSEVDPLEV